VRRREFYEDQDARISILAAGQHDDRAAAGQVSRAECTGERLAVHARDDWLSNRVFRDDDDLVDYCCDAWNKLEAEPWTIMSIGLRDRAHRS